MFERSRFAALVIALGGIVQAHPPMRDDVPKASRYPRPPRSETVDDYHGTKVADPYRPLEDPDSEATRAWVDAENRVTFDYLQKIAERPAIRQRLTVLWDFEKFDPPSREGQPSFLPVQHGFAKPERSLHM